MMQLLFSNPTASVDFFCILYIVYSLHLKKMDIYSQGKVKLLTGGISVCTEEPASASLYGGQADLVKNQSRR